MPVFTGEQVSWLACKVASAPSFRLLDLDIDYLGVTTHYTTYPKPRMVGTLARFIEQNAPEFPGEYLFYYVFNILEPGDSIPLHFDVDPYSRIFVVALQSSDVDGLEVNGVKFTDKSGHAVTMVGSNGLPHVVDPVVNRRISLVLTYRKEGT